MQDAAAHCLDLGIDWIAMDAIRTEEEMEALQTNGYEYTSLKIQGKF